MEFYEFFEKLVSYVPADFQRLKTACENILPWLFGIIVAVIAALLAVKYKYLAVIVTTAFSGSMMFLDMIESHFEFNHNLSMIFAIVMGFCGLLCQCVVEKKELKETYEHIKENADKVKKKASLSKDKK